VSDRPSPLAALVNALPHAVVLVDDRQRIAAWNPAAEVLYGHIRADTIGKPALEVLFDEDDRAMAATVFASAARGDAWEGDRRVRRADGVLLVSSFRAVPAGPDLVAWIATDQMDQGLAEQERAVLLSAEHAARARAEEAFGLVEAIITSAPVGIAVFDLDLKYVRVNDAFASLSGVPAEDHVGGRVGDVMPLPPQVGADLRRVVTTGRTIIGRHVEIGDPADARHFTVSFFPVRTTAGVMIGAGTTIVEITDAKRAEAERARLLAQAEAAQQRLAILATASTVLTTTMELDELLDRLARVLTPAVADWAIIQLVSPNGIVEHVAVANRQSEEAKQLAAFMLATPTRRDGTGPVAEVLRTGQSQLLRSDTIKDALGQAAANRGAPDLAAQFSVRSSVIVPIEVRNQIHGVLILSTEGDRDLTDDDLDLAVEIAHRAALAVMNARAFQQEHQIAETLQRVMLPGTTPTLPGLEVAVRYLAASDGASVGGDWYDVIAFDDGEVGIVIGDVVGHDIAASTTMGQLRSALRAVSCEDHADPARALQRVDRVFDTLGLTYATCVLGIIDPVARVLRWSSAGHPPPVLLRDGRATLLTGGEGVILGVTGGEDAVSTTIELRDDDVLVLYTDGLVERRGEPLGDGLDRLLLATSRLASSHPETLADGLLAALRPDTDARDDDVAILVARVRPHGHVTQDLDLASTPASATTARHFAAEVLNQTGWGEQVDVATLLVSELVTNALVHGQPPCRLHIDAGTDVVEIAVEDADPTLPQRVAAGDLDESGRGYLLVEALSDEWGVRPHQGGGKAAWFRLART
jgi:PAS domain S-box-containing protein